MAQNDKVRDLLLKDVEEEIPIYTCFSSYEFDSFIRGYHVYQHIWATVEGEAYNCTREPGNEQDCNAVAVMYEDSSYLELGKPTGITVKPLIK